MNDWIKSKSNKLFISIFGPIGLLIIVGALFLYNHVSTSQAINSSLKMLNSLDDKFEIKINGEKIVNKFTVLKELKKLRIISAHHSAPREKIIVEVIAQNRTHTFELRRDSKIKSEYWVYHSDKSREIGRIRTKILDNYCRIRTKILDNY